MRTVLLFIGLFMAFLSGACTTAALVPKEALSVPVAVTHVDMAEVLSARTVALVMHSSDGETRAYCSGVWVSEHGILTANHCFPMKQIGDLVEYVVRSDVFAGSSPRANDEIVGHASLVVGRDETHDLVLLSALLPPPHGVAGISIERIAQGLPVQAMGQPLGLWWSYSSGEVAAVRSIPNALGNEMLLIQATVPISPGSSGGGLYDERGDLLGITHGSFNEGQCLNLFIHRDYLVALLNAAKKEGLK